MNIDLENQSQLLENNDILLYEGSSSVSEKEESSIEKKEKPPIIEEKEKSSFTGEENIISSRLTSVSSDVYTNLEKNPSNFLTFCCGSFGIIMLIGIIAGIVSYIVFGIMFLVEDYEIANDCNGSNLWAYVLTAIILSFNRSNAKITSDSVEEKNSPLCVLLLLGIIETALAIWGGIEIWDKSCSDLSDSNLWKFAVVTFCLQAISGACFLILLPIVILCIL